MGGQDMRNTTNVLPIDEVARQRITQDSDVNVLQVAIPSCFAITYIQNLNYSLEGLNQNKGKVFLGMKAIHDKDGSLVGWKFEFEK